jgi:hypothetical protein
MFFCAKKMQRNIWFIADDPTVVSRCNVENVPALISMTRPSSIAAVALPDTTIPTCSTWHMVARVAAPTSADHFHPG